MSTDPPTRSDLPNSSISEAPAPRSEWRLRVRLDRLGFGPGESGVEPGLCVDGYVLNGDGGLTLAVAAEGPSGEATLERAWHLLEEKGLALRRTGRRDDRDRAIGMITVPSAPLASLDPLLRQAIVFPIRCADGVAELTVLATPADLQALETGLRAFGLAVDGRSRTGLSAPTFVGEMSSEDWAFLGVLEAAGAHDRGRPVDVTAIAERIGMPTDRLLDRLRDVEAGLQGLVTGIFTDPGSEGAVGLTPARGDDPGPPWPEAN